MSMQPFVSGQKWSSVRVMSGQKWCYVGVMSRKRWCFVGVVSGKKWCFVGVNSRWVMHVWVFCSSPVWALLDTCVELV